MTLARRTPLKRSPIKRGTKRLPFRSAKRAAITEERRAFVARILSERPTCEGMFHLRAIVNTVDAANQPPIVNALRSCTYRSTEVHERLKRSRGGSIVDDDTAMALCHSCHAFTESEPRLATLAGMLTPSWKR